MTIASDNLLAEEAQRSTALMPTGTPAKLTIGASSVNVALPAGVAVVRLAASGTCWIKFGTAGLSATTSDILFPAGAEIMKIPTGATHIACIQDGAATGSLSITGILK